MHRRGLAATGRAFAVAVTLVAGMVAVPPVGAAAGTGLREDAEVRVVVRMTARAVADDVVRVARALGARPTGRIGRLRAVALRVAASDAGRLQGGLLDRADVTSVDASQQRWLFEEPSDSRFAEQRLYLDAIRATTAWARPAHGSPDVRIAVVDSGADLTHPDLAGKVVGRFNAVTGGRDVRDVVGHGTGVASVAAAATNNGVGIAGAGYDSSLLVAKVADRAGRIFTDDLAQGIVWAADSGADVVNLSLGGPSTDELERDAVAYAQSKGVLVVAAAGNHGTTEKQYPAALPDVLGVGATSAVGSARASFSSFGSWVDVGAPGRSILVATPGGGFEKVDGTSFSAPLVAGQVGLLAAYRPGRTAGELSAAVVGAANTARFGFARGLVDVEGSLGLLPPASAPTITSPAPGAVVSGTTTITVTSTAPRVRLTLADLTNVVSAEGGVATATFATYGLVGAHPVTADDCSRIDQCTGSPATTTVTVANPAPVLTAPAEGSSGSADAVSAAAEAPGGAVRFRIDGRTAATDLTAPYAADLSTARLTDGRHVVSAVLCRADGTVCETVNASRAGIDVTRLHPRVTGRSAARLSPGRDGRKDTVSVAYRLESRQLAVLRVRDASGRTVMSRRLGEKAAGAHRASWDGRRAGGAIARDGTYEVAISTRAPRGPLVGLATTTVVVDRTGPRIRGADSSRARVLPVRDGYRDRTRVTGRLAEPIRWLELRVRGRGGTLVRNVRVGGREPGQRGVTWDGRTRGGRVAPAGRYTLRLVAQDLAGNRVRSGPTRVTVSGKRLERRSGSMTVTARASARDALTDECSLVFRHSNGPRTGWVGYYSAFTCTSGDAYAVADHQVRLPKAARYGSVQVSAYGGRGEKRFRDTIRVTYHDRRENLSDRGFALEPSLGRHVGPRVPARKHLIDDRVLRWSTMATGVEWYDVRSYTVRYTYDVLR